MHPFMIATERLSLAKFSEMVQKKIIKINEDKYSVDI